ncbi:MAG: cytidylyltransferase domain-containing protein [Parachlamydiaceae bacterium]
MKTPKVVAIIQARQGSTRLPQKSMMPILGKPLLGYVIEQVSRAQSVQNVVVATTALPMDDAIQAYCTEQDVPCFRGPVEDVLERYLKAAEMFQADVVVRITGDCPLIDPALIDLVVSRYLESYPISDYASNVMNRTYPRGMDVEVFSFKALNQAAEDATAKGEREHVTLYLYSHPELFSLISVEGSVDDSHYRLTVDTQEDFVLIKKIIEHLYPQNPHFTLKQILEVLAQHPGWKKMNAHIEQKKF